MNYAKLFFKNVKIDTEIPTLNSEVILTCAELLGKVEAELRLSDDQKKMPRDLLKECLEELEEKGFLNCIQKRTADCIYQFHDQRDKLKHFISSELKKSDRGVTFDIIHRQVSSEFGNFYTKDYVFKVIDELFQMGLIYEVSKCTYMYLN